jgi:hypothetical protein
MPSFSSNKRERPFLFLWSCERFSNNLVRFLIIMRIAYECEIISLQTLLMRLRDIFSMDPSICIYFHVISPFQRPKNLAFLYAYIGSLQVSLVGTYGYYRM